MTGIIAELHALPRGRFRVMLGPKVLVASATDPEHAACRALLALGITGTLVTRWTGANHDAVRMAIEAGARMSMVEESATGLRRVKWRPVDREAMDALENRVGAPADGVSGSVGPSVTMSSNASV